METVFLPGLDGTGLLFDPLKAVLPPGASAQFFSYPTDVFLDYAALASYVAARLPQRPYLLVGESFAGPLALRVAHQYPTHCRGVLLVASFVTPPAPPWLRRLPLRWAWHRRLRGVAKRLLLGAQPGAEVARLFQQALAAVPPAVLAGRLRAVLAVDARAALTEMSVPLGYLRARQDRVVPARCARLIRHLRPACFYRAVPGPHLLLQAQPAAVWALIEAFRAGLSKN